MNNTQYLLALHSINGLGPIRLKAVLDFFKDPKIAWEASQNDLLHIGIPRNVVENLLESRQKLDPEAYVENIYKKGIKVLTIFDSDYPKQLKEIYDPPIVLYFKGEILPDDKKAIGIVGSRKMTGYGKMVTEEFTKDLVIAGVTIVSGLAKGVDTQAHKTAIADRGRTLAILGGGINAIYPPENKGLAEQISSGYGAVISEFEPDTLSLPGNFPARNRIISGLSLAILVTEAAEDSGSLITARLALEQGREVFAVPGPINSNMSKGPIDLIKNGAKAVLNAQDILDELGLKNMSHQTDRSNLSDLELSESEKRILEALENESLHLDEICQLLDLPITVVSSSVLKMEISGLINNLGGGIYVRA